MLSQSKRERELQQQRPVYSFPELRTAEILQCLDDLRIPFLEADLTKPTSSGVLRLYEAFSEIFMGENIAIGSQKNGASSNSAVAEILEYPELHADSIAMISFYRAVSRLMNVVGVDDFSLKDIIRPETPRLKLVLSAIINFAKFREEQLTVFEEFNRKSDGLVEQRNKLAARENELNGKINYFK